MWPSVPACLCLSFPVSRRMSIGLVIFLFSMHLSIFSILPIQPLRPRNIPNRLKGLDLMTNLKRWLNDTYHNIAKRKAYHAFCIFQECKMFSLSSQIFPWVHTLLNLRFRKDPFSFSPYHPSELWNSEYGYIVSFDWTMKRGVQDGVGALGKHGISRFMNLPSALSKLHNDAYLISLSYFLFSSLHS